MKNATRLIISALAITSSAWAGSTGGGENLLDNGDFEKKKARWKGDGSVEVVEAGNKALVLEIDDRKELEIAQKIKTKNLKRVVLTFRCKISEDFDGVGMTLRFVRPDRSSTYRTYAPDRLSRGKWKTYTWDFREIRDERDMIFKIETKTGDAGSIFIDDLKIVAKDV